MRAELTELQWLDTAQEVSLSALMQISGMPEPELRELVACGALTPLDAEAAAWSFTAAQAARMRSASRLRADFDLDVQGLIVALALLERVHALEQRLQELSAQLPGPM